MKVNGGAGWLASLFFFNQRTVQAKARGNRVRIAKGLGRSPGNPDVIPLSA
jgi:hypothetical protein